MKKLTPLKAIRKYCVQECMGNQPNEVRLCPSKNCPLYKLRFGKGTKGISALKVIRARCMDCGEGTWKGVKECKFPDCPLYFYRFGKNPSRKGIGGIGNIANLRGKGKK